MGYNKLNSFPLGSITAKGFLKEQLLRNKDGMGGHLDELEPGMIRDPYLGRTYIKDWNLEDQCGWGAEISGNYWSGLIEVAYSLGDEELIKKVTDWVNEMLKQQREDGYLGTYNGEGINIYDDYNAWGTSSAMRGLIAFYEATKREDVLNAVYRCMLWFCENWSGDKKTCYAGGLIIEPMVFCYKYTHDERLIKFAEEYSDFLCENDVFSISYKSFLEQGLRFNTEHTAGMGVNSRLPAVLYTAVGKADYLQASEKILDEIHEKATHLSGSPVSVAEYLAPVSSTAETEYCSYAFYNETFFYMSYITGKSKYGDRLEEMFYNGAQGARKKDEHAIAYLNAPNQIYATNQSTTGGTCCDMQVYAPCYPVACCPVNAVAVLGSFVRSMMLSGKDGSVYMNAYGPCSLNYGGIKIDEETEYPFRNKVDFIIKTSKSFDIYLRIPSWCKKYTVTINGAEIETDKNPDGFAKVSRDWNEGDKLSVTFEEEIEIVRVDDSRASKKYPIAIKRGPLLYSMQIKEKWEAYEGHPTTPLPDDWHWYNVYPDFKESDCTEPRKRLGLRRNQIDWNVALSEKLNKEDISVEFVETDGYVWENPKIKLRLKGYKAPYLCAPYPMNTFEPFEDKQFVTNELDLTLVPYGCTNLRITYFPIADK